MKRRYLCNMLRHTRYYALSAWDKDSHDVYMLQILDSHRMVFSSTAPTDIELIKGAKAVGVPIHGQHWADYFTPENALEKRMHDDVKQLSGVISKLVTFNMLISAGYSKSEAEKILKNVALMVTSEDDK